MLCFQKHGAFQQSKYITSETDFLLLFIIVKYDNSNDDDDDDQDHDDDTHDVDDVDNNK